MDLQLKLPRTRRYAFLTEHVNGRRRTRQAALLFVCEYVTFLPKGHEVRTDSKEMIAASDFGAWWNARLREGWVICDF